MNGSDPLRSFIERATYAYEGRHMQPPRLFAVTMRISMDRYDVIVHGVGADGILVEIPGRGIYRFAYTQVNLFPPKDGDA